MRLALRIGAVLSAVAAMYWFCFLAVRCAHVIRTTEASTKAAYEQMPGWLTVRVARRNLTLLRSVGTTTCSDVDYPLLLAANVILLERREEAIHYFDDALRLDHRPEVYFNRGTTLFELGRIDEAVQDFAVAVDFNPTLLEEIDGSLRERVAAAVAATQASRLREQGRRSSIPVPKKK